MLPLSLTWSLSLNVHQPLSAAKGVTFTWWSAQGHSSAISFCLGNLGKELSSLQECMTGSLVAAGSYLQGLMEYPQHPHQLYCEGTNDNINFNSNGMDLPLNQWCHVSRWHYSSNGVFKSTDPWVDSGSWILMQYSQTRALMTTLI